MGTAVIILAETPPTHPLPPHLGLHTRGAIGRLRYTTSPCNTLVLTYEEDKGRNVDEDGGVEAGREVRAFCVPGQAQVPQIAPTEDHCIFPTYTATI
jgi:hypothetical protein